MTTREEIEAAVERYSETYAVGGRVSDAITRADAYLSERAERQRRIEAAANAIEGKVVALLLGNGVDMRKHRIVIAKELIDIITRHLDGETDA